MKIFWFFFYLTLWVTQHSLLTFLTISLLFCDVFTGFFCGLFFLRLCLVCTVSLCPWHLFSSKSSFSLDNFIHAQDSICHISVGSSKNLHLYSNLSSDFKNHYPIRVFPKIPQTQNFCNRIRLLLAHNVPVFNLWLLSSRSTLHCLLCDHKVGPCKHLSFASCLDVKLCQNRVLKCPTAGRSVSFIAPSLWEAPSRLPHGQLSSATQG